jgi:hypothetical protein
MTVRRASTRLIDQLRREFESAGLPVDRITVIKLLRALSKKQYEQLRDAGAERARIWRHFHGDHSSTQADAFERTVIASRLACLEECGGGLRVVCERVTFAKPVNGFTIWLRRASSHGWHYFRPEHAIDTTQSEPNDSRAGDARDLTHTHSHRDEDTVMPHWKRSFPGRYMQTADLDAAVVATIAAVRETTIGSGDDRETKPVVTFEEPGTKSLVLNLTRAEAIASIAGCDDMDDWTGVRIKISRGTTRFQGKKVSCIVVDAPDDFDDALQPLKQKAV